MRGDILVSILAWKWKEAARPGPPPICWLVILAAVLFSPAGSFAQNDNGSNSRLDRLRGGNIGMKIRWSGESFSGLGTRADAMGGSISTLFPSGDLISANPAGLGFARGFQVTLDWAPPLKINPGAILGLEGRINDGLIEAAKNNNPPLDPLTGVPRPDSVVTPADVTTQLTMPGGLKGGAVLYATPYFAVGAAFHQSLSLETQITVSGIEFLAAALDDEGKETNRIFGTINGNSNVVLTVESTTLAIASERLFPNLAVGLAYDNFGSELNFESTYLPEGIISSTGGDTRFFNDPARIQYDSLYAITRGDWQGSGDRFRLGLGYHPSSRFSLDLTLNQPFSIDLSGPFSMVHNNIRALNLGAGENEDVLDVDVLVEDNLTKTEKVRTEVPGMQIDAPGLLSLGFSARWGANYVASAVYTHYFSKLAYNFAYTQFDSLGGRKETGAIRQGLRLKTAYRIGIGVEPLILGLGVTFAETFREIRTVERDDLGNDVVDLDTGGADFFIPIFSLGGTFHVGRHFRFDYVASLLNSSFFRFSTSYAFR